MQPQDGIRTTPLLSMRYENGREQPGKVGGDFMSAKKILLVENDDFYVEVIGTFVKLFLQHQIIAVRSFEEAFTRALSDNPDLILLDLESDGHQALELTEKMRDNCDTKRIPILALSQSEARKDGALGRGCSAFLTKPFKVRELEAIINTLLGRP